MKKTLTKKQDDVLNVIKKFINDNGYSPTVRELCELANLKAPATMHEYLKVLKNKGYITYCENKSRTIRVNEVA